jgi:hypothetical protein
VKFSFTSLALAAVLAENVWGRLWPITAIGEKAQTRIINEKTRDLFFIFLHFQRVVIP